MRSISRTSGVEGGEGRIYQVKHALLTHKLALMRRGNAVDKTEKEVSTNRFRQLMHEISLIMAVEVTRDLPTTGLKPVIVTILRGGLGMSEAMLELIPSARMGHIGLHRDSTHKKLIQYLVALPDMQGRACIIVDPVIGTGNVANRAIEIVKETTHRPLIIRYATIVAAPQGLEKIRRDHADVSIYIAEQSSGLDDQLHVMPSWGDASNKLFGIKSSSEE